ncbi:unnamed protein product [Peronospora belbahrii]|uniref:Cytochrome b5 heme-binding domain-containing protein n=1 Tax=Peronospora belbahrii TaxID=622444 RepID=A0ABN8CM09_9STRA|nr:unnamed protein product [Peronospora belbahrii]
MENPLTLNNSKILPDEPTHGIKTSRGFCVDPVLFPAPKLFYILKAVAPSSMSATDSCYPNCMDIGEDKLLQIEEETTKHTNVDMELKINEVDTIQTVDLEELGLATALVVSEEQEKSIVVDYEDSDEDHHVELREKEVTCALSACGTLTDSVADTDLSNGRLARRRSRCGSIESVSLRGKSVMFQQETTTESSLSTSVTDGKEKIRCSKVHKLCMCEVKQHRSLESCWLVSSGQVYDATGLVTAHPGGIRSILRKAGGPDCARDMQFHTKAARKMMEKCFIGKLAQCGDDVNCTGDSNCSIM